MEGERIKPHKFAFWLSHVHAPPRLIVVTKNRYIFLKKVSSISLAVFDLIFDASVSVNDSAWK